MTKLRPQTAGPLPLSRSYRRRSELKMPTFGPGANRTAKVAERKSGERVSVPCLGIQDALGTLRGQERTSPAGRAPRRELAGAGLGEQSFPPPPHQVQFPNPKPEPGSLAGNRSGSGDRISKAQRDRLTGDFGLGLGWGGDPDSSGWSQCPLTKPPRASHSRDGAEAARSKTQRQPDFISAARQEALCGLGQRRGVASPYSSNVSFHPCPACSPPGLGSPGAWGLRMPKLQEAGPRRAIIRHPFCYAGLCTKHPFSRFTAESFSPRAELPAEARELSGRGQGRLSSLRFREAGQGGRKQMVLMPAVPTCTQSPALAPGRMERSECREEREDPRPGVETPKTPQARVSLSHPAGEATLWSQRGHPAWPGTGRPRCHSSGSQLRSEGEHGFCPWAPPQAFLNGVLPPVHPSLHQAFGLRPGREGGGMEHLKEAALFPLLDRCPEK